MSAVAPMFIEDGAPKFEVKVTRIPTVTWTDELALLSATEVAVTVTLAEAAGAVYTVATPLCVGDALKVPHADVGVHDHVTPLLLLSLVTVAVMLPVALVARYVGAAP
jgi:hypothetical protein